MKTEINNKKVEYETVSRGMYYNEYLILDCDDNITDDELVECICACGLVFGYTKEGNRLFVNVD